MTAQSRGYVFTKLESCHFGVDSQPMVGKRCTADRAWARRQRPIRPTTGPITRGIDRPVSDELPAARATRIFGAATAAVSGSRVRVPALGPLRTVHGSFDPHGSSLAEGILRHPVTQL